MNFPRYCRHFRPMPKSSGLREQEPLVMALEGAPYCTSLFIRVNLTSHFWLRQVNQMQTRRKLLAGTAYLGEPFLFEKMALAVDPYQKKPSPFLFLKRQAGRMTSLGVRWRKNFPFHLVCLSSRKTSPVLCFSLLWVWRAFLRTYLLDKEIKMSGIDSHNHLVY